MKSAVTLDLHIMPISEDYTHPFKLPANPDGNRRVVYFPGSTIGNFTPPKARNFLASIREITGSDGGVLIGVDLKKDPKILEAAYNDPDNLIKQPSADWK